MAALPDRITAKQAALIRSARLFFVATGNLGGEAEEGPGPINLSPKGGVPLHVLGPDRVAFLDHPGSGNETARHLMLGSPITVLVCSFEPSEAAIVRLFGRGRVVPLDAPELAALREPSFPALLGPRQFIVIDVERSMTSCGYGVPVLEFVRERREEDRGRKYKD